MVRLVAHTTVRTSRIDDETVEVLAEETRRQRSKATFRIDDG